MKQAHYHNTDIKKSKKLMTNTIPTVYQCKNNHKWTRQECAESNIFSVFIRTARCKCNRALGHHANGVDLNPTHNVKFFSSKFFRQRIALIQQNIMHYLFSNLFYTKQYETPHRRTKHSNFCTV